MRRIISDKNSLLMSLFMFALLCFPLLSQAQTEAVNTPFDHSKTGFILRDVHTTLHCEQCHVGGIFKNTPRECAGCHSIGSRVAATPKPVNHIQTTFSCDVCHVSPTSFLVKNFKHFGIVNGCANCHGDQSGQSVGVMKINRSTHIATFLPCENCHRNTSTFLSARMDHSGITSGCASCHSGQSAGVVSQPVAHIATNGQDCGACHNTNTFLGAAFNHVSVVAGTCGTCHMGQQPGVKAMPVVHIPTLSSGNACDACHTSTNTGGYTSFLGAQYHASITAPSPVAACSTCHTGQYANVLGKSAYALHVSTAAQCDTCHTSSNTLNYTTFLGVVYSHLAADLGRCATCHNGATATGKSAAHLVTTAQCDTCHTASPVGNANPTWLGATVAHNAVAIPGFGTSKTCASCHNGVSATGKPAFHIATPAGQDCGVCHTSTNTTNYTTFFGASFNHVAITGRCDTCHNGVSATGKSAVHLLTTSDCVICHTSTNTANYTTFLGATFVHAVPPGVCSTCHNGVTALGKSATHMATTGACDSCHTTALTQNPISFLGASGAVDHTTMVPPAAGRCASCHNGGTAKGLSAGHIPVGALSCDSCHKVYGGAVTTFAPATMNHALVVGTTCTTCHSGAYATQGLQYGGAQAKVSNHIPTTITGALDCNTCHTAPTYTSATGWLQEKMNHNGAQGGAPNTCVTCHLTGVTYLGAMQKKNHNGASAAKDCSSSGCHKPLGGKGTAYTSWN